MIVVNNVFIDVCEVWQISLRNTVRSSKVGEYWLIESENTVDVMT